MNAIQSMIERLRARPDIGVVNHDQSWGIFITKGSIYRCEITIPHAVLEWFASVRNRTENKEVWSDWMDYEGYEDIPKSDLEQSMAAVVERFADRISKEPLTFPISIRGPTQDAEQGGGGNSAALRPSP